MVKQTAKEINWNDFPIDKKLLKALSENGFEKPLPIQARTLKATLLDNKHVLGAAQTGSGKTLAYAIPLLNSILSNADKPCLNLKRRICKAKAKKEDFELIDGQMVAIEDMIVDKPFINEDPDEVIEEYVESSEEEEGDQDDTMMKETSSCPEAIVLVPTRELAFQVRDEIDKLCKNTCIKTSCLIGGLSQEKQIRTLKRDQPQVIIATPGRLYDIVQSDNVEHLNIQSVASIRTLVIDEADRMVQRGHFEEMLKIIDIIKESKGFRRDEFPFRVYLYSATLTFLHELPERFKINSIAKKESRSNSKKTKTKKVVDIREHTKKNKLKQMMRLLGIERADTRVIDLNDEFSFGRPNSQQLLEYKINCVAQEKDLYLYYFIVQHPDKRILVFCNSKDCLRRLSNVLKYLGRDTLKLHADIDQKKRLSSLEKFRQRTDSILIATDVAARGLDIKDLDCVVHYQVPKTSESYIHRSGRTARLFKEGISLTLCEPKEAPYYRRLCNNINCGKDIADLEIDLNLKKLLKPRVALAQQCDKLDHQLRETKSDRNWFVKAAKSCEIELDEDDLRRLGGRGKSHDQNVQEEANKRRQLSQLQKQLNSLLNKPLITRESLVKQSISKLKVEVEDSE